MTSAAEIRITDSTLRDGSHAISHSFDTEQVKAIVSALDASGVPVIEVAHGAGIGGSSFVYGFAKTGDYELLEAAAEVRRNARLAILLVPGIGVADHLIRARELGVDIARIAAHCTEADVTEQHIGMAKRLGMEAIGFLMMSHMAPPAKLLEQAKMMEGYGADSVLIADSAGHLDIDGVRERIALLKAHLSCKVAIHAHNNLALAVANSLAALDEGVDQIDGCLIGLGAGAGNSPTEVLAATLDRRGVKTGIDAFALMDAAEEIVRPLQPTQGVLGRDELTIGFAGVYGSFLLHTQKAAKRFGVPTQDILLECGRRQLVAGQEDMIIDVAVELARTIGVAAAAAQ